MIKTTPIIVKVISEIKHVNGARTIPIITNINPINVKSSIISLPIQILKGDVGIFFALLNLLYMII
jgi:hypothetical protein